MTGTFINFAAIIAGSIVGLFIGKRFPERIQQTVMAGMGLFTLVYGVQMFLKTQNVLVVLCSVVVGAILGEWWQIETGIHKMGVWLENRFPNGKKNAQGRFVRGFLTASLMYCIGPIAILGSIQNGLTGEYNLLAIKSVLDGIASIIFSASLGIGVMFSSLGVLLVQGSISLLARQIQGVVTSAMMNEINSTGGIILIGIAIGSLLEIRPIRSGNLLPALALAPVFVLIFNAFGLL